MKQYFTIVFIYKWERKGKDEDEDLHDFVVSKCINLGQQCIIGKKKIKSNVCQTPIMQVGKIQ